MLGQQGPERKAGKLRNSPIFGDVEFQLPALRHVPPVASRTLSVTAQPCCGLLRSSIRNAVLRLSEQEYMMPRPDNCIPYLAVFSFSLSIHEYSIHKLGAINDIGSKYLQTMQ